MSDKYLESLENFAKQILHSNSKLLNNDFIKKILN